eukprot:4178273-Amphidinium_carterae.1
MLWEKLCRPEWDKELGRQGVPQSSLADLPEVKRAHEITLPLNSAVRKRCTQCWKWSLSGLFLV